VPAGDRIVTSATLTSKNLKELRMWTQHEYNEAYFSVFRDAAAI